MGDTGDWIRSIGVLTTVEAIRKRPGMYLGPDWRDDALLPSKLVRQCLLFAVGATEAHITIGAKGAAAVSFDVPTDHRLFESTPGPCPPEVFDDALVGHLAAINAMSAVFQAVIHTDEGEWSQRFEQGVEVDPWQLVYPGKTEGPATTLEIQLDAEYLPTVEFDTHWLMQKMDDLPFPVTLVF